MGTFTPLRRPQLSDGYQPPPADYPSGELTDSDWKNIGDEEENFCVLRCVTSCRNRSRVLLKIGAYCIVASVSRGAARTWHDLDVAIPLEPGRAPHPLASPLPGPGLPPTYDFEVIASKHSSAGFPPLVCKWLLGPPTRKIIDERSNIRGIIMEHLERHFVGTLGLR